MVSKELHSNECLYRVHSSVFKQDESLGLVVEHDPTDYIMPRSKFSLIDALTWNSTRMSHYLTVLGQFDVILL